MQKRHLVAPRAGSWLVVDQFDATRTSGRQCGLDIVGPKREMMDTWPVAIEIAGNRPTFVRFKQFEKPAVELKKDDRHPVEPLAVHNGCIEQLTVQLGEPVGIVGRYSGVMKLHTNRSTAIRIKSYHCVR